MPSYRNRGAMAQQVEELLRHYREREGVSLSVNDILEMAIDTLYRQKVGTVEEPYVKGWDEFVLSRDTPCADTGVIMSAGTKAWREVWSDGREGAIYSRASLVADGVLDG